MCGAPGAAAPSLEGRLGERPERRAGAVGPARVGLWNTVRAPPPAGPPVHSPRGGAKLPVPGTRLQEGGSWAPSLAGLPGPPGRLSRWVGAWSPSPRYCGAGICFCWGGCPGLRTQGSEEADGQCLAQASSSSRLNCVPKGRQAGCGPPCVSQRAGPRPGPRGTLRVLLEWVRGPPCPCSQPVHFRGTHCGGSYPGSLGGGPEGGGGWGPVSGGGGCPGPHGTRLLG